MEFSRRKLPKEATQNLRLCPIESVQPYALMLAPVYVYMQMNEKYVAVKAPLDFFTPEELARLRPLKTFYLPEFVDQALPFREAGRSVRALLLWAPDSEKFALPPAPYEISDAVLRVVGPVWGVGTLIEPFFVATLVNELCDVLDGAVLRSARDLDVKRYERAIFLSSWVVFLALHLGRCDLDYLNRIRRDVFTSTVKTVVATEVDSELLRLAEESLEAGQMRRLSGGYFEKRVERAAQQISARLRRVSGSMIRADRPVPSIVGPLGFVDG